MHIQGSHLVPAPKAYASSGTQPRCLVAMQRTGTLASRPPSTTMCPRRSTQPSLCSRAAQHHQPPASHQSVTPAAAPKKIISNYFQKHLQNASPQHTLLHLR
ncbi:MAG: hypothetical protein EAY75_17505 [Bacteroidetes bacterium]|nr:MAG: hypothetical protein EAY75_17505 [Bacteroidota bacterium]